MEPLAGFENCLSYNFQRLYWEKCLLIILKRNSWILNQQNIFFDCKCEIRMLLWAREADMAFVNTRQQVTNTLWLMADNFYRLGLGFAIAILMARKLGPENYGVFNYSLALVGVFTAIASLGMNGIVVRDIINKPDSTHEILSSSFINQLIGSMLASILVIFTAYTLRGGNESIMLCIFILIPSIFFRATETIKYWYESTVQSKRIVISQTIAVTIGSLVKLCALMLPISFYWIPGSVTVQALVLAALLIFYFKRDCKNFIFKASRKQISYLLKESWPLVISGLVLMLYMRIDQIMLGGMLGDVQVGIYSVALRFIEIWYFLPVIICSSLFPNIIKAKSVSDDLYKDKMQKLYNLLALIGISISVFIYIFSEPIIKFFFGSEYIESAAVIKIYAWVNVFYFLSSSSGRWYINEGLQKQALIRNILGLIIAVCLNYILIPSYGVKGAAIGTLITYIFTGYLSDLLHSKTRSQFVQKTKSLVLVYSIKDTFILMRGLLS